MIGGIITAVVSFRTYKDEQTARATEQAARADAQEQHAKEILAATKRELEAPYQEKKLALYLDAARVLAHLAATPDVDKEKTEGRFWELYWGELAFVKSQTKNPNGDTPPSVEQLMVQFCHIYFQTDPRRCTSAPGSGGTVPQPTLIENAAIEMAHQASKEIRDRAESIGK